MKRPATADPVRVFVGGTFDGLHLGHVFLLEFARRRGLALARRSGRPGVHLSVVVARDESVRRIKHRSPHHTQRERRRLVASLKLVDAAFVGVPNDFVRSVRKVRPDLIVLGYDQSGWLGRHSSRRRHRRQNRPLPALRRRAPEELDDPGGSREDADLTGQPLGMRSTCPMRITSLLRNPLRLCNSSTDNP